ncbi:MAG: MBL fold metallo-hydrolase [Nocardioidaceae bacterium]|nr:MBL fold metallo-hydrolase [Nocardioidaceae bacterium]MDQ3164790.1 MBL fold metallo-hydrolase [Actinomycetota bacterium]
MRLTKYTHSCVRLDHDGHALVIDPGMFSEVDVAMAGADAVLITHEHPDHVDVDTLTAIAEQQTELLIWCPESVRRQLYGLGERVAAVEPGESFDAAGLAVRAFGGQHELIHADVPVVANVGFLIEDAVYHPGDSFSVPEVGVETLLLPIHAPWSKVGEVLDFLISVRAPRVHQIHDGLLNERGMGVVEGHVDRVAQRYGSRFEHLDSGDSVDL